ncbi:hypothetical protein SAY86_023004 [Trapa natans]|uniref:XPG-I domain-containing protein n=1 Tax=Trapa natans TaxID=22666 RepID=A0AAN7LWK1_TRANT|nr:hypothetical protein SAY86_023004 [Trapa natans]
MQYPISHLVEAHPTDMQQVSWDEENSKNVSSLRRNMGSEFSCMIKEAKLLGQALGIPSLNGIEEAEAQCALLNSEFLCDGCFTSDSDAFLFGARTVYRDICLGDGGYVVCYEMSDIERQLGLGRNSLIALAILLGSDYSHGVHGFGQESACHIVKSAGDESVLQMIVRGGLPYLKKSKGSKKQGKTVDMALLDKEHKSEGNEFLLVINAYTKPKCHSADSDAVNRVLSQHPFDRAKLHQICSQLLDWPPETADDYILPKIAERDLRRFANLRLKSAAVGLELPINQIPVKCPVSGIVKHRKVQGRECFEVTWECLEGLKTSIVPADLLESACPERIREFEENIAQKKKPKNPKPRQRKPRKNTQSVAEIDLKLQNLMLDINLGRNTYPNSSASPSMTTAVPEAKSSQIEISSPVCNPPPPLGEEFEDNRAVSVAAVSGSPVAARTSAIEFIDLLSPSSDICTRPVSKYTEAHRQQIDVIDLSESENDASPEHVRKARELRLFIAGIKNDK